MTQVSANVPSVNQNKPDVEDNVAEGEPYIDPVHLAQKPDRLPDEPEPTAEEIAARKAEEAAAAEAERKKSGKPTKAELQRLLNELPDDDAEEGDESEDAAKAAEEAEKAAQAASGEEGEEDGDEEEGDADAGSDKAKQPKRRRRSTARRERRAMQRRIDSLENELSELRRPPAQQPAAESDGEAGEATPAHASAPPKLDDYEEADQWAEAMAKWTREEIVAGMKRAEEVERRRAEEKALADSVKAFDERCEEMRDLYDDFDEVVHDKDLKITPQMAEVIRDSELGPQIAYHLGTNPEESERIAGLSPLRQAKELARIETRLEAEQAERAAAEAAAAEQDETAGKANGAEQAKPKEPASQAAPAPQRTATKAPAPPTRLSGGTAHQRNLESTSMDDYAEGRRSGKIR